MQNHINSHVCASSSTCETAYQVIAVVVAHNRHIELKQVISALLKQTRGVSHIWIVDNQSTTPIKDGLSEEHQQSNIVSVYRSGENTGGAGGFAFGLNQAMEYFQSATHFWLMDDDAVPEQDALEKIVLSKAFNHPNTGVLCSSVIESHQIAPIHRRYFHKRFGLESAISISIYHKDEIEIDTGSFVGFLVSRKVVEKVGLPDSSFFIAYDDTDYSLQIKQAGFKLWLIPQSKIIHLRLAKRLRDSPFSQKHYYNIRNRIVVMQRYAEQKTISSLIASVIGFGLLFACKSWKNWTSVKMCCSAIKAGWQSNLKKL
jgi:rhamnopyranosyl-N-acetylglucosaminyl-diphospho-decaprenol beta-1,3/1,4-galactofuranosyltransferase